MKVLLFNGSPRKDSNTGIALATIARELEAKGIETETITIGTETVAGCKACGACGKLGRCAFDGIVNDVIAKLEEADGYVFGTPTYYSSPNGTMVAFMDRLFYAGGRYMRYKPAASIAVARRAGAVSAYDVLNKYIEFNNMLMVPAPYWNDVYGAKPGEAESDLEGMSIASGIGQNMAWLLAVLEQAKAAGIEHPEFTKAHFNYIR